MKKDFILNDQTVRTLLQNTTAARKKLSDLYDELDVMLNPEDSVRAAKLLLSEAKTPEAIKEAQQRLFALQGEPAKLARTQARRLISSAYNECKATVVPLLDAAIRVVESARAKAVETERAWLASQGVGYEATQVSKRYLILITQLKDMKQPYSSAAPQMLATHPRHAFSDLLAWFK